MSSDSTRILGIAGSLRRHSLNRQLIRMAGREAGHGHTIELFDRLKDLPPFDEDDEAATPWPVEDLRARIAAADAVLVATPEYNASVPGQLKNAIDWASRPFATNVLRGRPVAIIGASPSPGGARGAIADAQRILDRTGAMVIPETLSVPRAFTLLDSSGALDSPDLRDGMSRVLAALVSAARAGAFQSV